MAEGFHKREKGWLFHQDMLLHLEMGAEKDRLQQAGWENDGDETEIWRGGGVNV